jgi:TRAP-type C4-dicarboxylate transport system permease small subunit
VTAPADRAVTAAGRLLWSAALVAGVAVLGMMAMTAADVFMRYVFNAPLGSTVDVTQMAMVVAVFFALAHCGWTGGHVVVDVVAGVLPRVLLRPIAVATDLVGTALMLGIAWQSVVAAVDYAETGEVSFTIQVPLYPFLAVVAAGSLAYAAVLFATAARAAAGPVTRRGEE